ncbi:uncharacterized protein LOC124140787 [Haliotis rufescens]|uniref:uncharacterized protein LOC124140787 n=1 Tax=Haliotis rufescens TaxID=6454 RepID=UPI001EAF94EE|nr:uncharacterized protein LOC124140787 [Haliotis rufescens]
MLVVLVTACIALSYAAAGLPGHLNMISGLAASRRHPGILYAIQDNAGDGNVYMLDATDGSVKGVLIVQHGEEADWEDIAVGPCPDGDSCIYIADSGDTNQKSSNVVYRVKEPDYTFTQDIPLTGKYHYTWNHPMSESLMVDAAGNVFILSQATGTGSTLGQLPSSGWTSGSQTAVKTVLTLPITTANKGPLAADISPDGKQLLIKTLDHVYVWSMPDMNVKKALSHPGRDIQGDKPENRGEAIAWSADGHGYYTEGQGSNEKLHFFNFP